MNEKNTNNKIIDKMIDDLLRRRKKRTFHLGPYIGISDVFENDPWFRSFYMEIAKFYGLPPSSSPSHLLSKQERVLSAFASINITLTLEEYVRVWHPWWKAGREVDQALAEEFCRIVYEEIGEQVVPIM